MENSLNVLATVGVVVIGRNEGERLRICLSSVVGQIAQLVYVDSGSTDDSVAMARRLGADVVELDMSIPFTAARARNEGIRRLREKAPSITFIQFVDGDCEVIAGWLNAAAVFLLAHPEVAAVCGRRRERKPGQSIYNLLCDVEWNTPVGEATAFGGDAMIRAGALAGVDGYRAHLIAGEDTELGVRLRAAGWKIWRIDREMTLHDAAILRFDQWWKRARRAGYAIAEGAYIHRGLPERFWVRESRSARVWGLVIPGVVLLLSSWLGVWALVLFLVYPMQAMRLFLRAHGPLRQKFWYATFLVIGKFPEMLGQAKFVFDRYRGSQTAIIEYK